MDNMNIEKVLAELLNLPTERADELLGQRNPVASGDTQHLFFSIEVMVHTKNGTDGELDNKARTITDGLDILLNVLVGGGARFIPDTMVLETCDGYDD